MCGRYTLRTSPQQFLQLSLFGQEAFEEPRYNIAPTQDVPVVRVRQTDEESRSGKARYEVANMRWGLVPSWAGDLRMGSRLINSRSETAAEKPSFRNAFIHRRCLIPADGFYEWKAVPRAKKKQPYLIEMRNSQPFAFAGLWEYWSRGDTPVTSCTILTTTPNSLVAELHDRMPVILRPEHYEIWLDSDVSDAAVLQNLLTAFDPDAMQYHAIDGPHEQGITFL